MNLRDCKDVGERRLALESALKLKLQKLGDVFVDDPSRVHCENLVGAISVPLGIAGPLRLTGDHVDGEFYIPLATTEGALVASVSRGCKAISRSGGAVAACHRVGTTRGPVFKTGSLAKSKTLYAWIRQHSDEIGDIAEKSSSHLRFKKYDIRTAGEYVFLRFYFDTQDAMGMNMVTIATQKAVSFIERKTGISCLSLAGNYDADKKPSWLNFINNRGLKAWAEATLTKQTRGDVLKTSAQHMCDVWLAKCMVGSAMSGSMSFNAHFANVSAAVFAATGQDLAHVPEASMGIVTMKPVKSDGLYVSVYLPDLMLGTIGGGTGLVTQTLARDIIGIRHPEEFAEVIAGAVLAGEISLIASLSEGSLAASHQKLGR